MLFRAVKQDLEFLEGQSFGSSVLMWIDLNSSSEETQTLCFLDVQLIVSGGGLAQHYYS